MNICLSIQYGMLKWGSPGIILVFISYNMLCYPSIISYILPIRKLRHKAITLFAQGPIASEELGQGELSE